jgi:8-oxo-dGTP pyrophosphatase MutT (NUDIX family)
LEFLLVKTKGGHRWTFPKGRIAKGEEFHRAAEREAAEEAGVTGVIELDPLTYYEYPGDDRPLLVAAYLLDVQSLGSPEETFRSPTWCLPDEAKRRLAQEREEHYVAEGHRLVDAALDALGDGEPR